jgi:hypothetical protein
MTYFFVGKHFCIPLFFLQVSFFSSPPFVLKQKVEPKVQGRHDRSAHAAVQRTTTSHYTLMPFAP